MTTFYDVSPKPNEPDHETRLAAARRYAGWRIGSQAWADRIIAAYANPAGTHADLDNEGAPRSTGVDR